VQNVYFEASHCAVFSSVKSLCSHTPKYVFPLEFNATFYIRSEKFYKLHRCSIISSANDTAPSRIWKGGSNSKNTHLVGKSCGFDSRSGRHPNSNRKHNHTKTFNSFKYFCTGKKSKHVHV